jgi:hypothetical protein
MASGDNAIMLFSAINPYKKGDLRKIKMNY